MPSKRFFDQSIHIRKFHWGTDRGFPREIRNRTIEHGRTEPLTALARNAGFAVGKAFPGVKKGARDRNGAGPVTAGQGCTTINGRVAFVREFVDQLWNYLIRHPKLQLILILLAVFGLVILFLMGYNFIQKRFLKWIFVPARFLPLTGMLLFILRAKNDPRPPWDLVLAGFVLAYVFLLLIENQYQNFRAGKPIASKGLIVVCGLIAIVMAAIEIREVWGIEVWSYPLQWGRIFVNWLLRP